MLDLCLQIISPGGEPEVSDIPSQSTASHIITSYLVSLGYRPTEVTFDLGLEAKVLTKITSWSLGLEKDPHSLKAARCCVGIADYAVIDLVESNASKQLQFNKTRDAKIAELESERSAAHLERATTVVLGPITFGRGMTAESAFRLHMDTALPDYAADRQQFDITSEFEGDNLHIVFPSMTEARALLNAWNAHTVEACKDVKMSLLDSAARDPPAAPRNQSAPASGSANNKPIGSFRGGRGGNYGGGSEFRGNSRGGRGGKHTNGHRGGSSGSPSSSYAKR
ncbi:hypothetical protein FB451DRAFT_1192438 [Mycena latifolia]|nr:hypothetical protein FB451DRAFT_1192438 [Mycena latifolia]